MLNILNTFIMSIKEALETEKYIMNLNYYKRLCWIILVVFIIYFLVMYLFLSFGLLKMMKDRFMKKTFLAFVPIYQFILMARFTKSETIMSLKKRIFLTVMLSVLGVYILFLLIRDFVVYKNILNLMFKSHSADDYRINNYITADNNYYLLDLLLEMLNIGYSVLFIFFTYDFLRYRTKSVTAMTILCIFFGFLFPIFVFATRSKPIMDYKRMVFVQFNGGYQNQNFNKPNKEEPFSEFSDKKTEEPFSDFGEESIHEENTHFDGWSSLNDDFTNTQSDKKEDNSSDDDMFD